MESPQANSRADRRRNGVFYTPPLVARWMVRRSLTGMLASRADAAPTAPLRILDPACGDGAFLWEAYVWLKEWYLGRSNPHDAADQPQPSAHGARCTLSGRERLRIIEDHLFGVDLDASAIDALRRRLADEIDDPALDAETKSVLAANLRVGNALTGPDFACKDRSRGKPGARSGSNAADPIAWRPAFPAAAAAGGFDVVLGNPPYRRECHAKAEFDVIARAPLGKRWRRARMDLWHYFFHRGLDLAQPGGTVSFIVNSYWTSSSGARLLIDRMEEEAAPLDFILLDDAPVFPGVSGRHLIFRVRKGSDAAPCRVVSLSVAGRRLVDRPSLWDGIDRELATLESPRPRQPKQPKNPDAQAHTHAPGELFHEGRLLLHPRETASAAITSNDLLGTLYEVRQGMAENPPAINRRLQREFGDRYRIGEGVFVLNDAELAKLPLPAPERELLRPYFETASLGRYRIPAQARQQVLYLTRLTAPDHATIPQIVSHLTRFRPILERRRETERGVCAWWHLHWPREERLFLEPAVLSVQMGRVPQFVYASSPAFVGFSVNLIARKEPRTFSLEALTGILNSRLASEWFARQAKRRGVHLEINCGVLKSFPLPGFDAAIDRQLARLVRLRQALESAPSPTLPTRRKTTPESVERRIDALVARAYGIARDRTRGSARSAP